MARTRATTPATATGVTLMRLTLGEFLALVRKDAEWWPDLLSLGDAIAFTGAFKVLGVPDGGVAGKGAKPFQGLKNLVGAGAGFTHRPS